ncbi:Endoglucanase-7 [Arthrobotrys entomopaga]|nr:Endoglucanase-7 [Arthrobotrys entomopaga]
MRISSTVVAIAALLPSALAHYRFTSFIAGSTTTGAYQYVRQNSNYNSPVTDVKSSDFTCNAGAKLGSNTGTYTVAAGSTVGFALDQQVFHPGPYIAYLGQAPSSVTDLNSWDGSGANWFKIYQRPLTYTSNGPNWEMLNSVTFKLPTKIPSGLYLLRIEHIALHSASTYPGAQFYISCAQIKVTGGSGGSPSKVSIPGVYSGSEPGIKINIYYPIVTNYVYPGPAVYS